MEYRLARPEDAEALRHLNLAFNGVIDVSAADIRASLACSGEIVTVAVQEGTAIAFCCAQVHHSFCYQTPCVEITEVYVAPDFRRQGVGRALLQFTEEHLRHTHHADECHLLTGCRNQTAQSFYREMGYETHPEVYLRKRLC